MRPARLSRAKRYQRRTRHPDPDITLPSLDGVAP